jgi:site-specific recombinase XerC
MKIVAALDSFRRQLAANGCSGHTQAAYRRDLKTLARWKGESPGRCQFS